MKIFCANTLEGLVPLYNSDFDEKKKLKIGEFYSCEIKRARNYLFLKKFFALCKIGCENSKNVEMPLDVYRKYVTMKAGYFDSYKTPKGVLIEAQSIAFDNMNEDAFTEVYSKVLDVVIADTDATKEFIENNLINFF